MTAVTIRTGTRQDIPRVLELVQELALYERAPHEVTNTVERMEQDGMISGPNHQGKREVLLPEGHE